MEEVTIGVNTYRIGKLDAMKQFHLARRLGPVLTEAGPLIVAAIKADSGILDIEDPLKLFEPIAAAMANMSDADAEYCLKTCLGAVERRAANSTDPWQRIYSPQGILMFDDINLPLMFRLAGDVVRVNLGNFTNLKELKGIPAAG